MGHADVDSQVQTQNTHTDASWETLSQLDPLGKLLHHSRHLLGDTEYY